MAKACKFKIQENMFKMHSVAHKRNQFTKPIRKRTLKQKSRKTSMTKLSGTQAIDRTWKELDRAIPHTLRKKAPIDGSVHREINSYLFDRVWSWLFRFNKRHDEVEAGQTTASLVKLLRLSQE